MSPQSVVDLVAITAFLMGRYTLMARCGHAQGEDEHQDVGEGEVGEGERGGDGGHGSAPDNDEDEDVTKHAKRH